MVAGNGKAPKNPSDDGRDRDAAGRFARGNKASRGFPYVAKMNRLRAVLFRVVDEAAFRKIVEGLVEMATPGKYGPGRFAIPAAKLILAYLVGRPPDLGDGGDGDASGEDDAPLEPNGEAVLDRERAQTIVEEEAGDGEFQKMLRALETKLEEGR